MKTITAALCTIALAALPSIATAGSAEVDVHRHVIVLPDDDVLIPRHTANVIIIDGEHRDCDVRTVRTWVAGRYVMRRVVHCDN
jgi:hypothetical protein